MLDFSCYSGQVTSHYALAALYICIRMIRETIFFKLAPYGTDCRLLQNLRPFQVRSHVTQKLGHWTDIKIWSIQNLDIVL